MMIMTVSQRRSIQLNIYSTIIASGICEVGNKMIIKCDDSDDDDDDDYDDHDSESKE